MNAERENRQLALANERLDLYRSGELSLAGLIAALDALWTQFGLASQDWLEEFRSHWWTLEQVHAVRLDRQLETIPDDLMVLVEEAVDQLGFMVDGQRSLIAEHLPRLDGDLHHDESE